MPQPSIGKIGQGTPALSSSLRSVKYHRNQKNKLITMYVAKCLLKPTRFFASFHNSLSFSVSERSTGRRGGRNELARRARQHQFGRNPASLTTLLKIAMSLRRLRACSSGVLGAILKLTACNRSLTSGRLSMRATSLLIC